MKRPVFWEVLNFVYELHEDGTDMPKRVVLVKTPSVVFVTCTYLGLLRSRLSSPLVHVGLTV